VAAAGPPQAAPPLGEDAAGVLGEIWPPQGRPKAAPPLGEDAAGVFGGNLIGSGP